MLAYRCLIVDDEKPAHKVILAHIAKSPQLIFGHSAFNGQEAEDILRKEHFDIIFLDINMPIVDGLSFLNQNPLRPATILTTAHSDHALEAYRNDVVDYLVKPILFAAFTKAVEKAKIFCDAQKMTLPKMLSFKTGKDTVEIGTTNILYMESIGNYLKVFIKGKSMPLVVYGTLSNYEEILNRDFVRVHKSYIVNVHFIRCSEEQHIILGDGNRLPVGRRYQIILDKTLKIMK